MSAHSPLDKSIHTHCNTIKKLLNELNTTITYITTHTQLMCSYIDILNKDTIADHTSNHAAVDEVSNVHYAYKTLQSNHTMYHLNVNDICVCIDQFIQYIHDYIYNCHIDHTLDSTVIYYNTSSMPSLHYQLHHHKQLYRYITLHTLYIKQLYTQYINKYTVLIEMTQQKRNDFVFELLQQNTVDCSVVYNIISTVQGTLPP